MARIRSIKPEFPQSETIGKLSRDARLLFIQLWTVVDDDGRSRAASRMLASLLYPYDDDAPKLIDGWLDELENEGCIRRYEVERARYLEVTNWQKHQKIDRPSASKLPAFDEGSPLPRECSRGLDADLGPRIRDLGEDQHTPPSQASGGASVDGQRKYPEDFEALWAEYRPIAAPNATKADAARAFTRLSVNDKQACWRGVVRYVQWVLAERSKRPDAPVQHLSTFINRRGWERFLEEETA
jgi:hypothetical protein